LNEALCHGGLANDMAVELVFIDSETLEESEVDISLKLATVDGILVPGGFGERGIEGKIRAIRYAREQGVPLFGICLGMQLIAVEYARNVLGLQGAMSREFEEDPEHPIIELMDAQRKVTRKGGTMRLGAYPCAMADGSRVAAIYGQTDISERHRHRFELNPSYVERLDTGGLRVSGKSPDGILAEIVELPEHRWYIGCQFHPEFKSRPLEPHPLFASYIEATIAAKEQLKVQTTENEAVQR